MKQYLLIGLAILIGTNIAALGGVAFNRAGEATSHLTLTERELSLPYNIGSPKENSGISLSINWRTSTKDDNSYYPYNSKNLKLTKDELLALGFGEIDREKRNWSESLELYWAFDFDGALHDAEIRKSESKYQEALLVYEEQPNDKNEGKEKQFKDNLAREKTSKSRLFFIEAAADYDLLATKFSGQNNILIVKGLAKYYYNNNDKTYNLSLNDLSVAHIMVPLKHSDVFSGLSHIARQDIQSPRYTVSIKWGSRLEPWVVSTKRLTD